MAVLSLLAPAKLNLFLHITGRRADGYHELQTLFQLLDYGDRLRFAPGERGVLSLHIRDLRRQDRQPARNKTDPIHGTPTDGRTHGTPTRGRTHGTPTETIHGTPTEEIHGEIHGKIHGTPIGEIHGTPTWDDSWDTHRDSWDTHRDSWDTHREIHGPPAGKIRRTPAARDHGQNIRRSDALPEQDQWDARRGDVLPLENNLILRAAAALARLGGGGEGAAITLEKRLPIGGGLGGGSADAAVCLLALNELWRLGLNMDELCRVGGGLGADVPVFIRGRSAWGEGIGEILEPAALPEQTYVVVTPPCHVSTAAVFNDEHLTRNSAKIRIADFLAGRCRNDCEPVARRLYPAVDEAFAWLGRFGEARMSGTGASVFLPLADEAAGEKILAALPEGWSGFVAQGIERMEHVRGDRASSA